MRRMLTLAMVMVGCGSPAMMTPPDLASSPDLTMMAGAYPPGPYGNTKDAIFPPLKWEGYAATDGVAVVNTLPFQSYSMDDARQSGKLYAMVHVSAFF